jgi:hypothetical protein
MNDTTMNDVRNDSKLQDQNRDQYQRICPGDRNRQEKKLREELSDFYEIEKDMVDEG